MDINASKSFIKRDLNATKERKRNFKQIKTLFDLSEKNEFTIDDQTWNDLIMDEVFYSVDRTYSTEGEAALYKMLRNPIMDEEKLKERGKLIDAFKEDIDLTVNLRQIFYNMIFDRKNRLIEMLNEFLSVSRLKYILYSALGIMPILLILTAIIFKEPKLMVVLLGDILVHMYIHNKEGDTISAVGLVYLRDLINAANKLSGIKNEEIKSHTTKIKKILKELGNIDRST